MDIGPLLEQYRSNSSSIMRRRSVQWHFAVVVFSVNIGPCLEQQPRYRRSIITRRYV